MYQKNKKRGTALMTVALVAAGVLTAQLFMGYSTETEKTTAVLEYAEACADSACVDEAELYDDCEMEDGTVYVCTGEKSVAYHKHSRCRGLSNCSAEIKGVTTDIAQRMGRRKCRICYR